MSEPISRFDIRLPADLADKLALTAERTGCETGELMVRALRQFLHGSGRAKAGNAVCLSAPINAIVEGFYTANTTMAELKERGDFGLGTFNYLDGEMVLLDGLIYQIRSDGEVRVVPDEEKSPFACVTFFSPDTVEDLEGAVAAGDIGRVLDRLIPSANMLYAIRMDGRFKYMKTRSAPRCESYTPLVDAVKKQTIFELTDVEGSLAGFYTPRFMEQLNAPGYHLHFLTADRLHGGHVLACEIEKVRVGIQHVPELRVDLPITLDFLTAEFERDTSRDLDKAEK